MRLPRKFKKKLQNEYYYQICMELIRTSKENAALEGKMTLHINKSYHFGHNQHGFAVYAAAGKSIVKQ